MSQHCLPSSPHRQTSPQAAPGSPAQEKHTLKVHLPNGGFNVVKYVDTGDIRGIIALVTERLAAGERYYKSVYAMRLKGAPDPNKEVEMHWIHQDTAMNQVWEKLSFGPLDILNIGLSNKKWNIFKCWNTILAYIHYRTKVEQQNQILFPWYGIHSEYDSVIKIATENKFQAIVIIRINYKNWKKDYLVYIQIYSATEVKQQNSKYIFFTKYL